MSAGKASLGERTVLRKRVTAPREIRLGKRCRLCSVEPEMPRWER
jgi:hypothetical protein